MLGQSWRKRQQPAVVMLLGSFSRTPLRHGQRAGGVPPHVSTYRNKSAAMALPLPVYFFPFRCSNSRYAAEMRADPVDGMSLCPATRGTLQCELLPVQRYIFSSAWICVLVAKALVGRIGAHEALMYRVGMHVAGCGLSGVVRQSCFPLPTARCHAVCIGIGRYPSWRPRRERALHVSAYASWRTFFRAIGKKRGVHGNGFLCLRAFCARFPIRSRRSLRTHHRR